mmetsp:Transcript_27437/g.30773  ORF Transcript_27437/g.30773 Transcript_27437/m.30773 type:complete len:106 (-) Transcript_27437:40-357(-)
MTQKDPVSSIVILLIRPEYNGSPSQVSMYCVNPMGAEKEIAGCPSMAEAAFIVVATTKAVAVAIVVEIMMMICLRLYYIIFEGKVVFMVINETNESLLLLFCYVL